MQTPLVECIQIPRQLSNGGFGSIKNDGKDGDLTSFVETSRHYSAGISEPTLLDPVTTAIGNHL